jgi:glyoxylase-like metal-dependent hydrolase (beta-lactamase superfamily II)
MAWDSPSVFQPVRNGAVWGLASPAGSGLAALALAALTFVSCGPAPRPAADGESSSVNEDVRSRGEGKDQWWDALPRPAWARFEHVDQSQDWFEVYRVADGVLAIYEPGQFEEVISYLVIGSDRALLFDTGLGIGDMGQVVEELTDRPVLVLNSHTHYDHVGGNHLFADIYGTDLEFTHRNAAGRTHAEVAEFVGPGWIWKETPPGFSVETYASAPFSIGHWVADGEVLDLGGVRLEVLLTPGHAPDSLCLLDRERRMLWSGDTLYPATLYAHLPGSSVADYARTAARLAELSDTVDLVFPSHNEPMMSGAELRDLDAAWQAVQRPEAPYVVTDGLREYPCGRFSILVTEPPPWIVP